MPKHQFEKGNPGGPGRPKTPQEIKDAMRMATPKAIEYLKKLMDDEAANPRDRLKAAELIMDRGYGKPAQEINISGDSKLELIFDPILKDELGKDD